MANSLTLKLKFFSFLLVAGLLVTISACKSKSEVAAEQKSVAKEARIDMVAENFEIESGALDYGSGSFFRMTWLPETEQPKTYSFNFLVDAGKWTENKISFVPKKSGIVTIILKGPWEEMPDKSLKRLEVYFDNFVATGATVPNPSFEIVKDQKLAGWRGLGTFEELSSPLSAVDGKRVARVWHDEDLSVSLLVQKNKKVSLGFQARAVDPK